MTDKVQKIKEWISKTQDGLMDDNGDFEYPEHEGAYHILCNLDAYIDSLQEEPVSGDLEEAAKNHAAERYRVTRDRELAKKCKWSFKAGAQWQKKQDSMLPKIWPRENLDDFAYQVAYDLSEDWMRETPTWDDVEIAVKLGAKWKSEYPDDNYDWLEYQLNLKLPETLDYNGVKVDRVDFIKDIIQQIKS